MKSFPAAALGVMVAGLAVCARGDRVAAQVGSQATEVPSVGTHIDSQNADRYAGLIPRALRFAIMHGLVVNVVGNDRIAWPADYQRATEKYSAQVTLDSNDVIRNYVAGLPFPEISESQAGTKVAYNWRFGPFLPREIAINAEQKTRAYSVDDADPEQLRFDESNRDYRNENNCEQVRFLRTDRKDGSESERGAIEWRERGDECGPDRAAVITSRYLSPAEPDEEWGFIPVIRKWRQLVLTGGYPNQSCSYSCTQIFFEYLPPKTEVYSITLIGKRPVLACIEPDGNNGIIESDRSARFSIIDCEVRDAYELEMVPRVRAPEGIIPARVLVDAETFLYMSGDFYRDREPDSDIAIWRRRRSESDAAMVLANDFYVPADRANFILTLDGDSAAQLANESSVSKVEFNPRAAMFSDGRM
jgi:Protein of unknown function (DUF1329)